MQEAYTYFAEDQGFLYTEIYLNTSNAAGAHIVIRTSKCLRDDFAKLHREHQASVTGPIIRFVKTEVHGKELPAGILGGGKEGGTDCHVSIRISCRLYEELKEICATHQVTVSSVITGYMGKCIEAGELA